MPFSKGGLKLLSQAVSQKTMLDIFHSLNVAFKPVTTFLLVYLDLIFWLRFQFSPMCRALSTSPCLRLLTYLQSNYMTRTSIVFLTYCDKSRIHLFDIQKQKYYIKIKSKTFLYTFKKCYNTILILFLLFQVYLYAKPNVKYLQWVM